MLLLPLLLPPLVAACELEYRIHVITLGLFGTCAVRLMPASEPSHPYSKHSVTYFIFGSKRNPTKIFGKLVNFAGCVCVILLSHSLIRMMSMQMISFAANECVLDVSLLYIFVLFLFPVLVLIVFLPSHMCRCASHRCHTQSVCHFHLMLDQSLTKHSCRDLISN